LEPYYQSLYHIPVIQDSSVSIINGADDSESSEQFLLVNKGTGRNIGLDITFERFSIKGFITWLQLQFSIRNTREAMV
jgi:hypothetical protein